MRILVACEYSGKVREAFRSLGHDVTSCDLLPSDDNSPNHIIGDCLDVIKLGWDLIIMHPPLHGAGCIWQSLVRQRYAEAPRSD